MRSTPTVIFLGPDGRVVGRPPAFDGSVTVLARDSALADALSTARFVMGPAEGLRFARAQPSIQVVYLTPTGPLGTLSLDPEKGAAR